MAPISQFVTFIAILTAAVRPELEYVRVPELIEFGKLYGEDGSHVESNLIGYTFTVNRNRAPVNATWARALPNPDNGHFTYQPLTGSEPNIRINTEVDKALDVINTSLKFDPSKYNNISEIQFVLRLSLDYNRGPVDMFLFANNTDLHDVPLPAVQLPHSSTYLVPETRAENNTENEAQKPVDIVHEVAIYIPGQNSSPELQILPSFVRVYEEYRPTSYLASNTDFFLIIPKHPDQEQEKYKFWSNHDSNGMNTRHQFTAMNAFKNDSGLYQFDMKVETEKGPVYEISTPFLIRRHNYSKSYEHSLPCSPYRRDTTGFWHRKIGFVEGTLPCVRYLAIGQNYKEANLRVSFLGDDYDQPLALNNDKQGLYDLKDRFFIVNNPDDYAPWDLANRDQSVAIESQTVESYRLMIFKFQQYKPVIIAKEQDQVEGNSVTFHCSATNAEEVKVVRISKTLYNTFTDTRNLNLNNLKSLRNIQTSDRMGVEYVEITQTDGVVSGVVVKFNLEKMDKLFEFDQTVLCLAYNRMEIKTKLLQRQY